MESSRDLVALAWVALVGEAIAELALFLVQPFAWGLVPFLGPRLGAGAGGGYGQYRREKAEELPPGRPRMMCSPSQNAKKTG